MMKNAPAGRIKSRKKRSFAPRGARALTGASAPTPRPARSWARRRTCRPSRPAATSPTSTVAPTSSAWARSCARSSRASRRMWAGPARKSAARRPTATWPTPRRGSTPAGPMRNSSRLTKKCLSPEAIDRPKDAQAVADGLSDYLAGVQERLQEAERERAVAEAKAVEERRRRRVQLALAASLLAFTALGWPEHDLFPPATGRMGPAASRTGRGGRPGRRPGGHASRPGQGEPRRRHPLASRPGRGQAGRGRG